VSLLRLPRPNHPSSADATAAGNTTPVADRRIAGVTRYDSMSAAHFAHPANLRERCRGERTLESNASARSQST
jgi:hypothetical protein